jgi:pullulanase/glycogen debranching enzyme
MNENILLSARIQSFTRVELVFRNPPSHASLNDFFIGGGALLSHFSISGRTVILETSPLDVTRQYRIKVRGAGERDLMPDGVLDRFFSEKPLGAKSEQGNTAFRLFAPRATRVHLVLFDRPEDRSGTEWPMTKDADGVWETVIEGTRFGACYGYRVWGNAHATELFNPDAVVSDPYSEAVVSLNHFTHASKSLVPAARDFEWEAPGWICPDLEDLVIYEMHVRDATIHVGSGIRPEWRGSYLGLTETGQAGGLDYVRSLGVNAVELMPCQEFSNLEPDFQNPFIGLLNTWNPYARNHWGYMTSHYFAPESYYASGGSLEPGRMSGADGRQVNEFKRMVDAFHKAGIAVILDVVYNHVSQYDLNPFKLIDKKYYFRLDDNQDFTKNSGCGNDFKTERPMARRLITDSLLHWMREYRVDGFRFDLAAMLDDKTLDVLTDKTRELNPRVILIAEPWGGGKNGQAGFSRRGWASWNDSFRNGIKGRHPKDDSGLLFGARKEENRSEAVKPLLRGTTTIDGGPFLKAGHSINYLESHDDYTFGDFIRIAMGRVKENQAVSDNQSNARLSPGELKVHKLGALVMFTSQGAVMLHAGQEFGRSKVIAPSAGVFDPSVGRLDFNSYNKDNETNWIDYGHALLNHDLTGYYRGLIALRKAYPAFRRAPSGSMRFLPCANASGVGFILPMDKGVLTVLLNGHASMDADFILPGGEWEVLADQNQAGIHALRTFKSDVISVPPASGTVLLGPSEQNKQRD